MVASTKTARSKTPRKPTAGSHVKTPAKPNHSILNFFKKTDKPEDSLFLGVPPVSDAHDDDLYSGDGPDNDRFNEIEAPNKKRRLSQEEHVLEKEQQPGNSDQTTTSNEVELRPRPKNGKPRIKTPFVIESDSEDDDEEREKSNDDSHADTPNMHNDVLTNDMITEVKDEPIDAGHDDSMVKVEPPELKPEDSTTAQFEELGEFAEVEDLDPDTFEGEEMRERLFMREQARLEAEEGDGFSNEDYIDGSLDDGSMIPSCPICDGSLEGVSPDEATRHVNSCLDGNALPLPKREEAVPVEPEGDAEQPKADSAEIGKRFARAAVPRPGQANPLELSDASTPSTSAFSKLMSTNAEDTAWASAAAAQNASRGRPAYERTCPFYKIMPGFSICVDAFRYGAVKDCQAYFLSHFHSDHYIGLTSNWRHGPIYCSKVTGSLVRNQLRTAAKWVVELDFDKPYDVPGTGASVTMIPANHCPGSSLFLFQKAEGKAPNSKVKRILHCGDFRACPGHVTHPLLKPDILDSISGKSKQQKIDICYLDTTYLNPRYSFPPQDDVITACAELCGSMSPDPDCKDDVSQRSSKAIGTPAVSKYFHNAKSNEPEIKTETKKKPQQRLLVVCGTYSIGKERICIAIAKALGSKIFASASKIKICKQLEDPELAALLTSDPLEAQVHMQMIMEIRAETLQEYLNSYKPYFSRIAGFRPSGWNYRPASTKSVGPNTSPSSVPTEQVLHGKGWRSRFGYKDLVPQRGSTKEAMCFGVPYSEHSSFRELAMFVMALRIEKVIPTVNVGSEKSRKMMKAWIDRWMAERRRGGLVRPLIEGQDEDDNSVELWAGKSGKGGGAWW